MKFNSLLLLIFFFSEYAYGQAATGKVSNTDQRPLEGATISSRSGSTVSDSEGKFVLSHATIGDTIRISYIGYVPRTFKLNSITGNEIILYPNSMLLKQITVSAKGNYHLDSLHLRQQFASAFSYRKPRIKDIFLVRSPSEKRLSNSTASLVSVNLLQVAALLTRNKTNAAKLRETLLAAETRNSSEQLFSIEKISAVTGLTGDSLQVFFSRYALPLAQLRKMSEYEIQLYIRKSYQELNRN